MIAALKSELVVSSLWGVTELQKFWNPPSKRMIILILKKRTKQSTIKRNKLDKKKKKKRREYIMDGQPVPEVLSPNTGIKQHYIATLYSYTLVISIFNNLSFRSHSLSQIHPAYITQPLHHILVHSINIITGIQPPRIFGDPPYITYSFC